MNFLKRVTVLLFVTLIMFLSSFIIFYYFNVISVHDVVQFFYAVESDQTLRYIIGGMAIFLVMGLLKLV